MKFRVVVLAAAMSGAWLAGMPGAAVAQGRGGGGGRGGFGGGGSVLPRAPGIDVPQIVNAVNLLVQHRPELALSDSQFMQVITIKRTLDSTNAPLVRKLDSVQRLFKNGPVFSEGSPERRDSLYDAQNLVREVTASVRDNNASWREKAYALLSSQQLEKAQRLESAAEQQVAESAQKGRSGGRGGKPPSG
jgi:hypothetical protein